MTVYDPITHTMSEFTPDEVRAARIEERRQEVRRKYHARDHRQKGEGRKGRSRQKGGNSMTKFLSLVLFYYLYYMLSDSKWYKNEPRAELVLFTAIATIGGINNAL